MSISLGPFLTCFFTIFLLIGYLYFILYHNKSIIYYGIKLIFVGIAFILLRTLIPINFPFTISVYFNKLLFPIQYFLNLKIGDSKLSIAVVLFIIWLVGCCYNLIRLILHYIQYPRYLRPFLLKNRNNYPLLDKVLQKNSLSSLRVAIVNLRCSPAIWGLHNPILILPNIPLTEEELTHIILHETKHCTNHDLWLKLLLNIVTCFHWYNPFIYLLNQKLTLAFELSNDEILLRDYTDAQKISYAECIMKISSTNDYEDYEKIIPNSLAFTTSTKSVLSQRIHFILSEHSHTNASKKVLTLLRHALLIGSMLFLSLIFVPEPALIPKSIEQSTMSITPENAYLTKSHGKYMLYVDGKYITTFPTVPEEFTNLPIKN